MVLLKIISIGVVAANMGDYVRWVNAQTKDDNIRYFPIVHVYQAEQKFDELVVTTTAQTNPEYFDIYVKLNGAYNKAKREAKATA